MRHDTTRYIIGVRSGFNNEYNDYEGTYGCDSLDVAKRRLEQLRKSGHIATELALFEVTCKQILSI